jgi:hypothetical protein
MRALLESRAAWVATGCLAAAGIVAYLVVGGSTWWWVGLAAVAPLAGLMLWRLADDADDNAPWIPPGGGDGPWGAP